MSGTESHHFVPQLYLRGFFDREQVAKGQNVLWSYRAGMKPLARGTKAIAAKTLFYRELSASEDEIDGVPLIPSACVPRHGGQADAHAIFKRPESSLA